MGDHLRATDITLNENGCIFGKANMDEGKEKNSTDAALSVCGKQECTTLIHLC